MYRRVNFAFILIFIPITRFGLCSNAIFDASIDEEDNNFDDDISSLLLSTAQTKMESSVEDVINNVTKTMIVKEEQVKQFFTGVGDDLKFFIRSINEGMYYCWVSYANIHSTRSLNLLWTRFRDRIEKELYFSLFPHAQ